MNPILVAGTGSWANDNRCDWYCPGHPFGKFLAAQGAAPYFDEDPFVQPPTAQPFIWSTDLSGVPSLFRKNLEDWAAGGAALAYFVMAMERLHSRETSLIVHSHGLQVAAFAADQHGLKIHTLISIGSPIRADMAKSYAWLRKNTTYWLHIHSDNSDRWQWFGELFDGHFGIVRETPLADRNDSIPGVGHSELLRDPAQYHHWLEQRWLDVLKG